MNMTSDRALRLFGGLFILILSALTLWHASSWIYAIAFVGFMLFQSGLTNFCPGKMILELFGFRKSTPAQ